MDEQNKKQSKRPVRPGPMLAIRVLAIGYALYMLFQIVQGYIQGGPDAPSVLLLTLASVILGGGGLALGIVSYRQWKKDVAAENAEREAARERAAMEAAKEPEQPEE